MQLDRIPNLEEYNEEPKVMDDPDFDGFNVDSDIFEDKVLPLSEIAEREKDTGIDRFSTGFTDFDEVMEGGFKEGDLVIISGISGEGKCHGKGTKILMHDGSAKNVEDIFVGDKIMGDDSKPRKVLSLARGKEMMYEVIPVKGDSYVVNKSHILSLKNRYGLNGSKRRIVDISVKDYIEKSEKFKKQSYGYKPKLPMNFCNIYNPESNPYLLGLWIADGRKDRFSFSVNNKDTEIINFLYKKSREIKGSEITIGNKQDNSSDFHFVFKSRKDNPINNYLRKLDVLNNKHISHNLKIMSIENRLEFLAGYLDGDGYLLNGNNYCYGASSSNIKIIDGVEFICRSLGFSVSKKTRIRFDKRTNKNYTSHELIIGGDIERIPIKLERKKINFKTRTKDWNVTGIKLKKLKVDNYYGFELDGNHRYLLGDFSVTHNTSLAQTLTYNLCKNSIPTLWFSYEVSAKHLDRKFKKMGIDQFYYVYTPEKNTSSKLEWVKHKIKESYLNYMTKVVVIDHIDFLTPTDIKNSDNETIALKKIVTELKTLAIKLNMTIILMAHLKKLPEGKEPDMQDIGHCLPAGSKILNADTGDWIDIEDIYKNNNFFNVISLDENLLQKKELIKNVYDNGTRKVYKIKTLSGFEIEASENHKFIKNLKWTKVKNLKKDDYLVVPGILPKQKKEDKNINLTEIIGWMIGDGHFSKYGTGELVVQDKDDFNHIKKILKNINVFVKKEKHENYIRIRFQSREFKGDNFIKENGKILKTNILNEYIKELGLKNKTGKDKFIPSKILSYNNESIAVLLRGLFQSDGYVSDISKGRERFLIEFSNINLELTKQMKFLLLRFGIRSKIIKSKRKDGEKIFYIYKLIIEGKKSILIFDKNIKLINKKGKNIKKLVERINSKDKKEGKEIYKFIPLEYYKKFFDIKLKNKITWKNLGFRIPHHQKRIKKTHWNKLCKLVNNNLEINEDIDFDKIKSIEFIGEKKVYDIEVENTHNFVCNGLFTHNSAGIFQLADYVFMIWREKEKRSFGSNKFKNSDGDLVTNKSVIKIVKNRETGQLKYIVCRYINERFLKEEKNIEEEIEPIKEQQLIKEPRKQIEDPWYNK